MSVERVRLVGGALQGQVVWVEQNSPTLRVHIGGQLPGVSRILHYRRSGAFLRFVEEIETTPHKAGGSPHEPGD